MHERCAQYKEPAVYSGVVTGSSKTFGAAKVVMEHGYGRTIRASCSSLNSTFTKPGTKEEKCLKKKFFLGRDWAHFLVKKITVCQNLAHSTKRLQFTQGL